MTEIPTTMDQFEMPDPVLTNKILTHLKSQGIFDQFRRECMADVDTKPAYQNLRQRVEGSVATFLRKNPWRPEMNKNQMRDNLRKHIQSGGFLDIGVDRIVDQVVNPKIYSVFLPKVEEVVQTCLETDEDHKPKFTPPPQPIPVEKPELSKFQNKHNLASRARVPAPLTGPTTPIPNIEALKPPKPRNYSNEDKLSGSGSSDTDENFVVDEEDLEDTIEDDEESPPFELHSENDRLILGVRTDSSDGNSNDSQVVTTIVDDNLEERIGNCDVIVKEVISDREDEVKKEEESSSDEYVPKTPTIDVEGSDSTVIEFNEYKQYQTKFDEENFGDVEEEVVCGQWGEESNEMVKEERSSNEDDSGSESRKRKMNYDNFDEESSSSVEKGSTSDEEKPIQFDSFEEKKFKVEDLEENETSELINEARMLVNEISESVPSIQNEDSETFIDMLDLKIKLSNDHREKCKSSSSSSKDSGKSHHHHHSQRDSSSGEQRGASEKTVEKDYRESSISSSHSSSKDKKEDKHSRSSDQHRDRKKSDSSSSSKHQDKTSRNKHKEEDGDKIRSDKSDVEKEEGAEKQRKELRREQTDQHDKDRSKHGEYDKHSNEKRDTNHSNRHDKDKRDSSKSSKHGHSSSKRSHGTSSDRHKSGREKKHRESSSSDKHKSHNQKSEKDSKHESRKKYREHCKSSDKDYEERRSADRDSNGPSDRCYVSNTSRSTSSRTHTETLVDSSDRTTSNSDNTVSENVEAVPDEHLRCDSTSEQGIASPDPETTDSPWSDFNESELNKSNNSGDTSNKSATSNNDIEDGWNSPSSKIGNPKETTTASDINYENDQVNQLMASIHEEIQPSTNNIEKKTDDILKNTKENISDKNSDNKEQEISAPAPSVHDTSSEKENIEQAVNLKEPVNSTGNEDTIGNNEGKIVKFKKPKIAANIFEVKKIMQARRHLKRMEKKRMKLITKTNIDESPASGVENLKEPEDADFRGFDDVSWNKIKEYNLHIKTMNEELTKSKVNDQYNTNLITSLIEVSPELDDYIETVLKGKVHRKTRVRLPPISDKCYKYDSELNVYFLNEEYAKQKNLVDGNLNNLSPTMKNEDSSTRKRAYDESNCTNSFSEDSCSTICISEDSMSAANESKESNDLLQVSKVGDTYDKPPSVKKVCSETPGVTVDKVIVATAPNNAEVADKVSQKLIHDIVGVVTPVQMRNFGNSNNQMTPSSADCTGQRHSRESRPVPGSRQQRYDSSDLYKPRPQLSSMSRRVRGMLSPDISTPAVAGEKRNAVSIKPVTMPKRKR